MIYPTPKLKAKFEKHILSRPKREVRLLYYTVRKTSDTMLPVSLTETCVPWKLLIGYIGVSTLSEKD